LTATVQRTDLTAKVALGRKLGSGGFGSVFATNLAPYGAVAVKVLDRYDAEGKFGITDWTDLKAHLFAEAETLKKAAHTNVVRVFSVACNESEDEVYIFSELCDSSLQDRISEGPLCLSEAFQVTRELLIGLEALHGRGMIHRDMKPANLLAKGHVTKLSDFGLVTDRLVGGYASSSGYPEHLAPEVFEVGLTSTKTDVWATGVTLFRLLNGQPWYEQVKERMGIDWSNPHGARERIEELVTGGTFVKQLRWLPSVPRIWRRFVMKALQMRPGGRYQDGSEMATAFMGAGLPTAPSWSCVFSDLTVTWNRIRGDRRDTVVWERPSPRRHGFLAQSESVSGSSRLKVLATSGGLVSPVLAYQGLERFFGTRSM
jgi:serine/threonine protein kinase